MNRAAVAPILIVLAVSATADAGPARGSVAVPAATPPAPVGASEPPRAPRPWLTFDVNAGLVASAYTSGTEVSLGIGGWLGRRAALGLRLSRYDSSEGLTYAKVSFVGLAVQYWFNRGFWVGGGLGAAGATIAHDQEGSSGVFPGAQLRLGFALAVTRNNNLIITLEALAPISAALLIGYQYGSMDTRPSRAKTPRVGATFEMSAGADTYLVTGFGSGVNADAEPRVLVTSTPGPTIQVGAGRWLTSHVAITGRGLLSMGMGGTHPGTPVVAGYVGPSLQYWPGGRAWIGGGAGISRINFYDGPGATGFGIDLRAGYLVTGTRTHAMIVSAELNPSIFASGRYPGPLTATAFMLLLGYQYL
jgi:hypothetical protein